MSSHARDYAETAESIIEHAQAMTALDASTLGEAAYTDTIDRHVHAMRVLAAPHVDPSLDRAFYKQLKAASAGSSGVFVHFDDGVIGVIVDTASRQHRFELLSPPQVERRGDGGWPLR